jgi:two-component system nitrate/nitrite response regulator NarL
MLVPEWNAARRTADRPVRVVLADDECLFRACLRQLLAIAPSVIRDVYRAEISCGFEVVGEASSGEEAVRVVRNVKPDLLLVDLCMPRMSGLDAARELAASAEAPPTILLAGSISRDDLVTALHADVRGLIVKDAATDLLFDAMCCVVRGGYWLDKTLVSELVELTRPLLQAPASDDAARRAALTARERQVLELVLAGYANKEIDRAFAVSEHTVKHHLTRMFGKTGATNRVELAVLAAEQPRA